MTEIYQQKVEKVARAICEGRMWVGAFETLNNEQRYSWRRDARAALAALGVADTAPAPAISGGEMAAFGASDAACYEYPEAEQGSLREAFCKGAALAAADRSAS